MCSAAPECNISVLCGCRRGNSCAEMNIQIVSNKPVDYHTSRSLTGGLLTVFSDPVGHPGAAE